MKTRAEWDKYFKEVISEEQYLKENSLIPIPATRTSVKDIPKRKSGGRGPGLKNIDITQYNPEFLYWGTRCKNDHHDSEGRNVRYGRDHRCVACMTHQLPGLFEHGFTTLKEPGKKGRPRSTPLLRGSKEWITQDENKKKDIINKYLGASE